MIISYVAHPAVSFRLAVVGPLDRPTAEHLADEFRDRHEPHLKSCVLDLTEVSSADDDGLAALSDLAALARDRGVRITPLAPADPLGARLRGVLTRSRTDECVSIAIQ